MKLAEALLERADYQKRLEQLRERLSRNAKVQEGDKPQEDPQTLLHEVTQLNRDLTDLVKRINRTNSTVGMEPYGTIADALIQRESIMRHRGILQKLIDNASIMDMRYGHSEIKIVSTVDVASLQKQVDRLSKEFRQVDTAIQAINWSTDLM
ncbi:DIP1984 family protein [Brevibacillus dissolubilis]|uniref:DIP1984 family protein n=1 Tax=Brevibacillus dissolubilis TaxID=1844116 RepID=UPI00111707D1|nr:DIP1984 family protein [Brevibacillus dissolubilis]